MSFHCWLMVKLMTSQISGFTVLWESHPPLLPLFILDLLHCRQILYSLSHSVQFSSVAQLCLTLWPHESQHTRPPCPSPTSGAHSDSRPWSQWCHPAISSSVIPFSSCPQSLPASESFPMSQLFAWATREVHIFGYMIAIAIHKVYWGNGLILTSESPGQS